MASYHQKIPTATDAFNGDYAAMELEFYKRRIAAWLAAGAPPADRWQTKGGH